VIKKKADAEYFLNHFQSLSEWDGTKHYLTFEDTKNKGYLTVMNYPNEEFTFYRKNELFWDLEEHPLTSQSLIWEHRKAINKVIKE
jgi:predicted SAM-dependent methyltransferase